MGTKITPFRIDSPRIDGLRVHFLHVRFPEPDALPLILTHVSLSWLTGTFGSSSWPMYDSTGLGWPEGNPSGLHFVAMEVPDHLARDMREFVGKVHRSSRKER